MKITQKLTIHDVAARAGASASTVSAALNGTWRERRISADTAERIITLAREAGYSVNLQARGLRKARSGLVGLILPEHNNRFFSDLSQAFAAEARGRGLCPVIVATERNPQEERETVRQLIDYAIDQLFIAGAVRPEDLSQLCRENALPHVFIDQPCADAPSVVSDNREGAAALTRLIIADVAPDRRSDIVFLGGDAALNATSRRIEGFRAAMAEAGLRVTPDQVVAQSYETERACHALERLCDQRGGHLPAGLFINSLSVFEGALRFIATLPEDRIRTCAFGCYDYEPFGALLRFPLPMVRQRHRTLIRRAYQLLEQGATGPLLEIVMPELCEPGRPSTAAQA